MIDQWDLTIENLASAINDTDFWRGRKRAARILDAIRLSALKETMEHDALALNEYKRLARQIVQLPSNGQMQTFCFFCGGDGDEEKGEKVEHEPDCPWVQARTMVKGVRRSKAKK
jgi:hypothetical protein